VISRTRASILTYSPPRINFAPHQTVAVDIRHLRDAQVADLSGNLIPQNMANGKVVWFEEDADSLIGRAEIINVAKGMSSSLSCYFPCNCSPNWIAPGTADNFTLPSALTFLPGGPGQLLSSRQTRYDCNNHSLGTFDVTSSSTFSSLNTSIVTNSANTYSPVGAGITYAKAQFNANHVSPPACPFIAQAAPQPPATVKPKISGNTTTLWWFNGLAPSGYTITTTLTATAPGATSYSWAVSQTGTKVTLGTNGQSTMVVTSAGWSSTSGDVSITLTVNSVTSSPYVLTVRGPKTLQADGAIDSCDSTYAYLSIVSYTIVDNLGSALPSVVPVNEKFVTSPQCGSSYPSCNWVIGPQIGWTTDPSAPSSFGDHIKGQASGYTPVAVGPSGCTTGVGTATVQSWGQDWRIGSTSVGVGLRVQGDSLQKYIDNARHKVIVTPDP